MATHIVSFRISDGPGHADRWASVTSAIEREAADGRTWEETTSFYLLRSPKSAKDLADAIYYRSKFSPSRDILLVIDANNAHAAHGAIKYPATLESFFQRNALANALLG